MVIWNTPVLYRQMDLRVFADILWTWFLFWIPGAFVGSLLLKAKGGGVRFLAKAYVLNAVSLCCLCAIPAWVVGLPPGSSWKYDWAMVLVLAGGAVLGLASAVFLLINPSWKSRSLAATHFAIALFLFCLPLALTVRDSYEVYRSSVAVPEAALQDCASAKDYRFAQLSDLHVVAAGTRTRDNSRSGISDLPRVANTLQAIHPHYIFVTGDMTDGGEESEWSAVLANLSTLSNSSQIVMSPGNHDMNLVFDLGEETDGYVSSDVKRFRRFIVAQWKMNSRVQTFDGISLRAILANAPPEPTTKDVQNDKSRLTDCYWSCGSMDSDFKRYDSLCRVLCAQQAKEFPAFKSIERVDEYWQKVAQNSFPLVEKDSNTVVIVLGTIFTAPAIVGQNALGGLDANQLGRFDSVLRAIPSETAEIYILAHHPFTRPANETLSFPRTLSIVQWQNSRLFAYSLLSYDAQQARRVVDLIDRTSARLPNAQIFVLFGHRHVRSFSKRANIEFVESPNLGTDDPSWHGFFAKGESDFAPCWYRAEYSPKAITNNGP